MREEIVRHLKQDRGVLVTTMVDYYGMKLSWPSRKESISRSDVRDRATTVRQAMEESIAEEINDDRRFIAYISMYEFESLLFSNPKEFAVAIGEPELTDEFEAIRNGFKTPEHINDSNVTAPSKRIKRLSERYDKRIDGLEAIRQIGLKTIREECPLFDEWIHKLEEHIQPVG